MSTNSAEIMYKVLYYIFWSIYSLFEILHSIYQYLRTNVIHLSHEFLPVNENAAALPSKLPQHVTVLLGSEDPSFKDLASFIVWCLATGVSFISFYDYKGLLKKNQDKLHAAVQQKKLSSDHVIWHDDPHVAPKNGFVGRKIHVKVLSGDDGKNSEVDLIKKLALSHETDFSIENIDKWHRKQFEFPDPDLGICCGDILSLYGYPPWQIRVTEFLLIKSHHDVTFETFHHILQRYSKCEQRFGK